LGGTQLECTRFGRAVAHLDVVLEQPCATLEECAAVRAATGLPMKMDELAHDTGSFLRAYRMGIMDAVAIKLSKFGGLSASRRARDLYLHLGARMCIEDTWGSDITTAALLHLAAVTPECALLNTCDLSGYVSPRLDLSGSTRTQGRIAPPEGTGLCPILTSLASHWPNSIDLTGTRYGRPFQCLPDPRPRLGARYARQPLPQSWSKQGGRPRVITGAEGSWFWDSDGKRYLDFQSQLVNANLGHQHPKIVQAIKDQADRLCYIGPAMGLDVRSELAALMVEVTPANLTSTFFTTGGAAANEMAIRLARHYTGRTKIIARYRSYHGATGGTLSLTGDPRHHLTRADMPGVVRMLDPYTYRCPAGHPDPCPVCWGRPHLEELLMYENPETVAAVILETVVGTNGIIVPPDGYLQSIREVCDRYGILLIADVIMAGFGRSGEWFAVDHWGVQPDILNGAKGINSGYVPLGTMSVSKEIADWLKTTPLPGGLTYAGHPLACASGVAAIWARQEEDTLAHATRMGALMRAELACLADKHPSIGDMRGLGMFNGIELVKDRETREPLVPFAAKGEAAKPMTEMMASAMDEGLYLSFYSNVIRLTPPLNVSEADMRTGLEILDRTLEIADREYG
jgi:taurine---2-oxoglutarate transaminase